MLHAVFKIFRSWLRNLPDKGEKIQKLHQRVIEALEKKHEIDDAANLLKDLNLESKDMTNLEWEGSRVFKKPQLDSDDDEDPDPLAVLLSTNSVASQQKIVKHIPPVKSLITEQDLKEAEEIKTEHLHLDPVLEHMCQNEKLEPEHRFLPYKNAKQRDQPEHPKERDNTAATPPVTKQVIKMLTLRESMEAENANRIVTKEVSEKHAAERLAMRTKELKAVGLEITSSSLPIKPLSEMNKYRLPCEITDEATDESDDSYESALSDEGEE